MTVNGLKNITSQNEFPNFIDFSTSEKSSMKNSKWINKRETKLSWWGAWNDVSSQLDVAGQDKLIRQIKKAEGKA